MLMRVLVDKSRAPYCKPFCLGWQGHWTNYMGATAFSRFDDPLGRLIQNTMVVGFKPDANFLLGHACTYSKILVTTPAPTVRPPSRMANFEPCSRATGTISSAVRLTSWPGMTISAACGRVMLGVGGVVRM